MGLPGDFCYYMAGPGDSFMCHNYYRAFGRRAQQLCYIFAAVLAYSFAAVSFLVSGNLVRRETGLLLYSVGAVLFYGTILLLDWI